ncbi:protein cornichon homolog 1 [Impatiens glandulifera]|uniref:protein cornichon homolog 1 n=1 Tax=Impatiens glandulifera TaxID=253017 RepID=UPI001FB13C49|nr:protein cornichon homolog 1 [Impatiens glandulifera]
MAWEVLLWTIFFLFTMTLIALNVYQMVCLSDLESDYMNPYEASTRINSVILPEFVVQTVFCILFLVTGHWIMFLLLLPITSYSTNLFLKRQHLIDVTEVFRSLQSQNKYRYIKLSFYLVMLLIVFVRLVIYVINYLIDEVDDESWF